MGIGLAARLLGLGRKIRNAVAWCFATPARFIVTILALALVVQTIRIEGLFWLHEGYKAEVARLNKVIKETDEAGNVAVIQQTAMNDKRVATETKNAEIDDVKYEASKDVATAAAATYIDRWRVRDPENCTSKADSAAESGVPRVPEAMPPATVLVSERDVQACTLATTYAIAAHEAAVSDVESGTAVFLGEPQE